MTSDAHLHIQLPSVVSPCQSVSNSMKKKKNHGQDELPLHVGYERHLELLALQYTFQMDDTSCSLMLKVCQVCLGSQGGSQVLSNSGDKPLR